MTSVCERDCVVREVGSLLNFMLETVVTKIVVQRLVEQLHNQGGPSRILGYLCGDGTYQRIDLA